MTSSYRMSAWIVTGWMNLWSSWWTRSSHIEYVLDRMRENTTYVRNIKKYLLAALYNAPATIDSYYTSLVSHDMYGSGERR